MKNKCNKKSQAADEKQKADLQLFHYLVNHIKLFASVAMGNATNLEENSEGNEMRLNSYIKAKVNDCSGNDAGMKQKLISIDTLHL
eukprot:383930-Ditylum_brightwellii.AAC.1